MPVEFRHHQFANGLDLIAEIVPGAYSVAAGMFVNTGSRDETLELSGVSHFLEHMMFKGSDKYTWQDVNRIFDEMARLMNDAAGVAQGVRREFDALFRSQAERILRELDVVPREEFEAVKEMARLAREENEALKARLDALEAKSAKKPKSAPETPAE